MLKLSLMLALLIAPAIVVADGPTPDPEAKVVLSISVEEAVKILAETQKVKVDVESNHYSMVERVDAKTKQIVIDIIEIPALVPQAKRDAIAQKTDKAVEPTTKARRSFLPHRHRRLTQLPANRGYRYASIQCSNYAYDEGYEDSEIIDVRGPFGAVVFAYDCYGVSRGHHHHHDHDHHGRR